MNWKSKLTTMQVGNKVKYIGSPEGISPLEGYLGCIGTAIKETVHLGFPGFVVKFTTGEFAMAEVELEVVD